MTRTRPLVLLACAALLSPALAPAQGDALPESARGVVGSFEVVYPDAPLRARPITDRAAPLLVRVTALGEGLYRVEYLGLTSGTHDVAPLLERADGRPADGLGALPVRIVTQLPEAHGADVFGQRTPAIGSPARYWAWIALLAVAWIGAPVVYLVRRALRRQPVDAPPAPARVATPAELLLDAVRTARQRELTTEERGRLELLLLRTLRTEGDDLAESIAALRRDPRTAAVVLGVERWLHANAGASADAAFRAIEAEGRPA